MESLHPLDDQQDLDRLMGAGKVFDIWDNVLIHEVIHAVVRVEGRPHSSGGRWGLNDYYAYPVDPECPHRYRGDFNEYLMFGGHAICWGIRTSDVNTVKHKWGEVRVNGRCNTWITLNGEDLLHVPGDMDYAISKARALIVDLSEKGIANFAEADWERKLVGSKIYYRDQPAIVTQVCPGLDLIINPVGMDKFDPPAYVKNDLEYGDLTALDDYEGRDIKVEYLSENITWYRQE